MNDTDDEIKGGGDVVVELQPEMSTSDADDLIKSVSSTALKQREDESLGQPKDNDVKKEKEAAPLTEESLNTVRLLGEPLVTHGPYTFYNALAYRQRNDVIIKNRQRWKKRQSQVTVGNKNVVESCDSSSSCCCSSDDADNDVCSCDDGSPLTSKQSDWSVIQMNHFYAVRPWYSKKNSSTVDRLQQQQHYHRKHSPKLTKSTEAKQQQHHHQQSVCIGELELLWRDDSVITSTTMSSTSSLSSSSLKKRSDTKPLTEASNGGDEIDTITSSHHGIAVASSDDDDGDGDGNYDGPTALLPRRRLPRRTRQPSAKKLEAAESYAAAVAASAHEPQPTQQVPHRRNQLSATGATSLNPTFASGVSLSLTDTQYKHGNLLCSVRLYVMPDQTAPGRLGGVHGEDEVLEINTWGASGSIDRWQNNVYMNSGGGIRSSYNGGSGGIDDYGYGSGSHSSGTLPSSCSGLVLRAEDFVEWVRGGLMNSDDDENENENTDSEHESIKSECVDDSCNDQKMIKTELPEQENEQQKLSPLTTNIKEEIKTEKLETCHDDKINKIKLESTAGVTKNEVLNLDELKIKEELSSEISINLDKEKTEQEAVTAINYGGDYEKSIKNKFDNHCYSKSTVDEAIKVESIPLAAAKIHKRHRRRHHCLNSKSLVNGSDTSITVRKHNHCQHKLKMTTNKEDHKHTNNQVCYCYCCKHRHINQSNDKKTNTSGGINKQQLVVMSYSRYCRYRAQLQRKREEQLNERDIAVVTNGDGEKNVVSTHQGEDNINTTRVLFCRDTYDYPAELLLEPFNTQQCQQQNTSVLVNHLAPKLKGWPAYPSSWMSFRWNRVRRRLRHLDRGSGSNDDNRRRRRRRKLKKKCRHQNEASDAMGVMNYSSSSEDDDSDNSDSDDSSSATNDATTNTTTTASTSDSDGAIPPPSVVIAKTVNKNHSSTIPKVNGGIHHNDKKNHSLMASNMITINGVTSISATAVNKRPVLTIQQSGELNPMKRRRVVYTQGPSQHQNQSQQRIIYQQQQQNLISRQTQQQQQQYRSRQSDQLNQHMLVVQQHQQRLHSFNQRLSTSSSPLQAPSARIVHHHLPPSVSIMPVIMSNSNMATQQQRFKQNRPKQHISAGVQRQNNNNDRQQTLAPVIIEYDKTQERGSNDNGRCKKSTVTYHRRIERHDFKGDQSQQREDDRQRRWLVDALRLGGLEVTAVPLNVDTDRGNNNSCGDGKNIVSTVTATLQQQQQRRRQRGISFESLSSTTNKHIHNGDVGKNEPSLKSSTDDNSNFNSEIMTITPDVLSMLDKSEHKHQLVQKTLHHNRTSLDRASTSMILAGTTQPQQQRRRSINIQSNSNNSSSQQPHSTKTAVAAAALHDKIYRAIDSLKQQQKQQNLNTSTSVNNRGNNVIVMSGTNYHQSNSDNNYRQQHRRLKNDGVADGIRQQQQTPALLDLTVKSLTVPNTTTNIKQQKTLLLSPTINPQQQQQRKIISPFHSTATSDAANLEISIVPVTVATTVNSTRFLLQQQHQQKYSSSTASHENSTDGSEVTSSLSLMTVRQQLQRNVVSTVTSSTTKMSFLDILCGGKNRHLHNVTATSTSTTTITTSQEQPQQQQQILFSSASSAVAPAPNQQQNIKRKPQ